MMGSVVDFAATESTRGHTFQAAGEGRYALIVRDLGISFEIDRLRRDHHELIGELAVKCDLPGAATYDGALSIADFNVSSARARQDRARLLASRAHTADELDWFGLLEELCQRVLLAERTGKPAVSLRDLPRPQPSEEFDVDGFRLLAWHPVILFGDGGSAKSYLGLYTAGVLAQRGERVGLFDWELAAEDHRERLERLFGAEMPAVQYVRCDRPLVHEVDRLARIARDEFLSYAVFDSVAFACDGPPEAAEVAAAYFRAVRQINAGSLHVAHINRSETSDQKPFGSAFWHNGARSTWFVKLAETSPDERCINLALYNRKANLGPLRPAVGFEIAFEDERTTVRRANVADIQDLAERLPLWQRMSHLLRGGARTMAQIAEELDATPDAVKKTLQRRSQLFTRVPGTDGEARIGLVERRRA